MLERLPSAELATPTEGVAPPTGQAPDIEDARIHEILARLGVILHDQIAEAPTFFKRGGGYDHREAVQMDDLEHSYWSRVFDIDSVVAAAVDQRKLFVVNIDDESPKLPSGADESGLVPQYSTAVQRQGLGQQQTGDTVRVNYGGEAHWVSRELVAPVQSTDGLTHFIKPEIHFGGQVHQSDSLYNAYVALNTYVQAENGTQLVSQISGTGLAGRAPVYHPHTALSTSLWMNTSVKEGEPNSLSVTIDSPEQLMLRCEMHDISGLTDLEIPAADSVRTWFWQLDRLVGNGVLALPQ